MVRYRWFRVALLLACYCSHEHLLLAADVDNSVLAGRRYVYKHSGGEPRELEVYFPKNHVPSTAKVPGLILFHGGGWTGGSLNQFRAACRYFADRGLVAATAEYRMHHRAEIANLPAGESHKRVCVSDAKSAIRWMKQHAVKLGVDADKIISGGGSAGAHIAVLATIGSGLDDPSDPKGIDTSVRALLLFNPAFSPDDRRDAEVDVLNQLDSNLPPAIVFFGTEDTWKSGWDEAHARLRKLGVSTTELWIAEGEGHGFFNKQPWQNITLAAADRFLVHHGLLHGEPSLPDPAGGERLIKVK